MKTHSYVNPLIQKSSKSESENSCESMMDESTQSTLGRLSSPQINPKKSKSKKGRGKLLMKKKKTLLKLPKPSEDPRILFRQKTLLAQALISKNIVFDDDLCFSSLDCPPAANNASMEANLQVQLTHTAVVLTSFVEDGYRESYSV